MIFPGFVYFVAFTRNCVVDYDYVLVFREHRDANKFTEVYSTGSAISDPAGDLWYFLYWLPRVLIV